MPAPGSTDDAIVVGVSGMADRRQVFGLNGEGRLLQTELLAGREQCNRLANTPFPRLRSRGRVNPHHEITPVGWSTRLKALPGSEVRFEGFGKVASATAIGLYRT